jgi:methyl-accepting chemotaxis protein
MTLARKISIFSAFLAIFVSLGIGAMAIVVATRSAEEIVRKSLQRQAEMGANLVRATLESQLATLQGIANRDALSLAGWDARRAALAYDATRLDYLDIGVVDERGIARYVVSGETADLSDRDYVKQALYGYRVVSDVIISKVTKKPVVMFAAPIPGKDGKTAGALVARRDGEALSVITDTFSFGETGYAFLVSSDGAIVAHRNRDYVLGRFNPILEAEKDPGLASLAAAVAAICSGKSGSIEYDMDGRRVVSGFAAVPDQRWSIAVTADRAELMSGLALLTRLIAAGAALFLAVGVAAAAIIGGAIARPVRSMLPVLETIARGDLTRRLKTLSSDELGVMAERFNGSLDGLSEIVVSAKSVSGRIDGIVDGLSAQMTETAASISQMAASMASIKERTTSQAASATESHAAIKEIRVGIERHDELVGRQAAAVAEASAAIEELIANVRSVAAILERNSGSMEETLAASELGKEGIEQVSAIIEGVAQDSEGLVEASDIIQSVASRTNLLAMNAAIEAAHAGEYGKGFAVVADEIRNLAENSAEQGKIISAVLGNLKQRISEAAELSVKSRGQFLQVLAMMAGVRDQEAAIKGAMAEELKGNAKVLEAIKEIDGAMAEVSGTSKEMLEGSAEVLAEIGRMMESAVEISGGMDEIAAGARQIDVAVKEVNEGTRTTKDSVTSLSTELSRFKV